MGGAAEFQTPYAGRVFGRFTDRARRVLVLAQEQALLLGHDCIGTEHILLGLLAEERGIAAHVLADFCVSLKNAGDTLETLKEPRRLSHDIRTESPPFTPGAKKALELSLREALRLGHDHIDTEHLLLGLIREGEGVGAQILVTLGVDLGELREAVLGELRTESLVGRVPRLRGPRVTFSPQRDFFNDVLETLCQNQLAVDVKLSDGTVAEVVLIAVRKDGLIVRELDGVGAGDEESMIEIDQIVEVRVP